jgi:hypothetical protein
VGFFLSTSLSPQSPLLYSLCITTQPGYPGSQLPGQLSLLESAILRLPWTSRDLPKCLALRLFKGEISLSLSVSLELKISRHCLLLFLKFSLLPPPKWQGGHKQLGRTSPHALAMEMDTPKDRAV